MTGCLQMTLFDPSYTTDGVSPTYPWGRTRHALNPVIPILIDAFASDALDGSQALREIREMARAYGELLQEHGVTAVGVALACAALGHAFDDAAQWVARRRELEPARACSVSERVAGLAESAIEVVNRSYDDAARLLYEPDARSRSPLKGLEILALAAAGRPGRGGW